MTATAVPAPVATTVRPRPGVFTDVFAGRTIRSDSSRYGPISLRRNAWFPSVIASAPASSRRSASRGVMPDPVGCVLAVHDADVDAELGSERRQPRLERAAPGRPHHVGDEEDPHAVAI